MALLKSKKAELVESYTNALKNSKSVSYVSFKNVPVNTTLAFRKTLNSEGLNYTVVKKTLWDIATKNVSIKGEAPAWGEELAVIYGDDLLSPARNSALFAKENKGNVKIVGGIFEGEFKSAVEMTAIASIPPKEVLLSQLAFLLKSPMQRIAIAVNEVAKTKVN